MEYLRLGSLRLGVTDGVNSFEESAGYTYAKQEVASGKPILQSMGETLSEISLCVSLRAALGHDVPGILTQIDQLLRSGTPQHFVYADGIYKGDYVVTQRAMTITRTTPQGTITEADITLSLTEYADRVVINNRNSERQEGTPTNKRKTEKR